MPVRFVEDQPKRKIRFLDEAPTPQEAQPQGKNIGQDLPLPGVRMGAMDPVYGIGQVVPRALEKITSLGGLAPNPVSDLYGKSAETMDKAVKQRETNYDAARDSEGFDWGRLAGNVTSPVNLLASGGGTLAAKGASLLAKMAAGASTGAATSAAMPVTDTENFASEKLAQTGLGALGGVAVPALGAGIGRVLNPQTDEAVKGLLKEGLKLTPGEMVGGGLKRAEDALTSVPVLGGLIRDAQRRSIESLNTAAINRALAPLGKKLPNNMKLGREAIQYVGETLGKAYDDLLPKLTGSVDQQFSDDLDNLTQMVDADFVMDDAAKGKFNKILDGVVRNRVSKTGSITGQAIKEIESHLGDISGKLGKSLSPSEAQLADALEEVRSVIRTMVQRTNPQYADDLKAINKGWANFKRVQRAASYVGADEGVFNPSQLEGAVKALDKSKDKGSFAKGSALMQDLTDPSKTRMAPKINNSGSADRALAWGTLFSLGGGAAMSPAFIPGAVAAAGYLPGGRRIAQALLTERPESLRQVGTAAAKYAPYLGAPLVAPLANQ